MTLLLAPIMQARPIRTLLNDPDAGTDELRQALSETYAALEDATAHLHQLMAGLPLTTSEAVALKALLSTVHTVPATVVGTHLALRDGFSASHLSSALTKLYRAGIADVHPHGRGGTEIRRLDMDAARALLDECAPVA